MTNPPAPLKTHSPGPFQKEPSEVSGPTSDFWMIRDANGKNVCAFVRTEANADLFMHAPETLRLLRELVRAAKEFKAVYEEEARAMQPPAASHFIAKSVLMEFDEHLSPLLTQIQKLKGGGE